MGNETVESEIRRWIQQADNAQDKALLMILYEMHSSLQENTVATTAIANEFKVHKTQFDAHMIEERDLFSQGRGLYKAMATSLAVISGFAGVVFALGGYILNNHINANVVEATEVRLHADRITRLEEQIKILNLVHPSLIFTAPDK